MVTAAAKGVDRRSAAMDIGGDQRWWWLHLDKKKKNEKEKGQRDKEIDYRQREAYRGVPATSWRRRTMRGSESERGRESERNREGGGKLPVARGGRGGVVAGGGRGGVVAGGGASDLGI